MKTPLLLLISLTTLCTATGDEGIDTYHLYGAIGSSVFFPEVKIDEDTVYDLTRAGGDLMVTCHDACSVRNPYTKRGHFYEQNGTFQLTDLSMKDNGTYELRMNLTVKGRIHLWIKAPVTETVFYKQERRENDSQCLITFTCHAKGDGLFNFTFLRNNKILHTVHSADNSSSLSMDGRDLATSGMFSCNVANPASSETSPAIELPIPATPEQIVLVIIVIGLLLQWGVALPFFLSQMWLQWKANDDERKPSAGQNSRLFTLIAAFAVSDDLFGFFKESFAVYTSVKGGFIPEWCCALPAFLLLCRTIHWITFLVNSCKACEKCVKIPSDIKSFSEWVTRFSIFFIFAFCVAILVTFNKIYYDPCGMRYTWEFYSYIVLIAFLVLVFITYKRYISIGKVKAKRNQQQTEEDPGLLAAPPSQVLNGGIGQPEDNQKPNCEQPVPDGFLPNTTGDGEEPQQQANCENLTEEGQPQVSKEDPCKRQVRSVPTPDHEDSDGTENREGRCLLTIEREVGAHDKDRVANG